MRKADDVRWSAAVLLRHSKKKSLDSCEMKMLTNVSQSNAQLRKIKKPLIERRRRERINESLCQLKTLVLEATNRDESCYSKMEKADILEMTVSHLRSVQRHPASSPASSSVAVTSSNRDDAVKKYLFGFNECAKEVAMYLSSVEQLADGVVSALMKHLTMRLTSFHRMPETQFPSTKQQYLYSPEVDENNNLLDPAPVVVRGLVPELPESVRPSLSAALSLNRDLFCGMVSLRVSSSSSVSSSPTCRASVPAKCSAARQTSGSSGNVEHKAEMTKQEASTSHSRQSLYLSSADDDDEDDDDEGLKTQHHHLQSTVVSSQENLLPSALVTKRRSHSSASSRSSIATSASAGIPPVMSTQVKNDILLSGSVWRPW